MSQNNSFSKRVSTRQQEYLLQYMSDHPQLAKGLGMGQRSKEANNILWKKLASHLNAQGGGSHKDADKWRKYWADMKHKTKLRAAQTRRDHQGTGGGPPNQMEDLSETDKKVLDVIGKSAVFGDPQHRVPLFTPKTTSNETTSTEDHDYLQVPLADISNIQDQENVLMEITMPLPSDSNEPESPCPAVHPPLSNLTRSNSTTARQNTPRSSRRRSIISSRQSRIEPAWIAEIENKRVEAEAKTADAAMIMAEAAKTISNALSDAVGILAAQSKHQTEALVAIAANTEALINILKK